MIQVTETLKFDPAGGGDTPSEAVDKILAGGNAVVGSEDAISLVLARFGASSDHITRTLQRVRESS